MQEAGLTHGGFYGHFASKAALAAEASQFAFARSEDSWAGLRSGKPGAFGAIIDQYLSLAHVDRPGEGCVTPPFAPMWAGPAIRTLPKLSPAASRR